MRKPPLTLALGLGVAALILVPASRGAAPRYAEMKPVVDKNCVPCHNPTGAASFLPFTSLAEIKGNQEFMAAALGDGYMPQDNPGFKDTVDGKALLAWLTTGTDLNGGAEPIPEPEPPHLLMRDPRELRYADVKPLIDRNCGGCHNPNGAASRRPLTNLAEVQRRSGDMWKQLDRGAMPRGKPEFRYSSDGRALMGWLRYAPDSNGAQSGGGVIGGDDDGAAPGPIGDDD